MSTAADAYLVGLIGEGITASLTPPMHEREADLHGLRYLYRPVDLTVIGRPASAVGELLRQGRDLGFNAFNITHPCKQLVLQHLDEVSDDAARLEAVNTVLLRDGKFIGHNTDFSGFGTGLANGLPDAELDGVVQLGAGGAGSAVAYALLKAGAQSLTLVDLDPERVAARAAALAGLFPGQEVRAGSREDLPRIMAEATGLVNASPVGMHSHPGLPIDGQLLQPHHWVADVVYRPVDTELVRAASAKGCRVLDGGHMAVGQAVDAFALITGITPDAGRMRQHFLELIAQGL
ncbi:shikimate 5-dehydrogenase [Arthrobacter crystallopoietes BAB-32]|uniref:Shikimate 5-dehydrogenase n=1 Tax=Arthrobacter crystallopoietes BAB-32 TaxID=1246476 RepID=N1UX54_9MICC|nr:shikimate dehydrogenase [Arthrobacter crystallopoietes]EMY32412.1 shikimate 5-dehydrogenase [Arthrobacter crystallopoietes BAB-32]